MKSQPIRLRAVDPETAASLKALGLKVQTLPGGVYIPARQALRLLIALG